MKLREAISKLGEAKLYHDYGTAFLTPICNAAHSYPIYNFKAGHLEDEEIKSQTGQFLVEAGYLIRRSGCFGCEVSCHRYTVIKKGPHAGTYSGGPEYESISSLAGGTGVFDPDVYLKANELCNLMGLDTISTGGVIQWAMESYERGVITDKDTGGMKLNFGNGEVLVDLIPMIARRRKWIGNLLAEGVKRASEAVEKDSWKWAICNSKGLEQSRVETRGTKGYGLAFAINPRGPDHLHACPLAEFGSKPEYVELVEKLTGDKKWAVPIYAEYRPEIVRYHEDTLAAADGMGFCLMYVVSFYPAVVPEKMAEMFSSATGIEISGEELMLTGRRIATLERCINVREGADRKLDDLPYRLMHEPAPTGPPKGMMNSPEELNIMLDKYYELQEWDKETSYPYKETLEMLGLKDVAYVLEKIGRLPKR